MKRVDGKTCIVTGGALGIGRAACELLAQHGANVAVFDVLDTEGQALAQQLANHGYRAHYWHVDVGNEHEVATAVQAVVQHFGSIDVLVNNAGIAGSPKPTHELTEAEWDAVQRVNTKGVFFCTKHVLPYLLQQQKGSIVNISSIYGLVGAPDVPAYHASKGAVRLMTKTDALLYAAQGIRVNSVHPGYILTPMIENAAAQMPGGRDAFLAALQGAQPLGHIGEPQDIAYGILYLASDESKFMTGSELVIDGGYTCR
jgi:NAD(P)-dependent dehydrogenase (short-subunit alcohol dehydrogenase family)